MEPKRIYTPRAFLTNVSNRARRLLRINGETPPSGQKRKYTRKELDVNEKMAHAILDVSKYGPCAELARNVVDIVVSVDDNWVEMFPVFEMLDTSIRQENCTFEVTPEGYVLRDSACRVVSQGATLRLFLQAFGLIRSGREVVPFDREAE